MKRVDLEEDRMQRYQRVAVWLVGIGFLLICVGLMLRALL
jgi:hypothetical protein